MDNPNDEVGREQLHAVLGSPIKIETPKLNGAERQGRRMALDPNKTIEEKVKEGIRLHPNDIAKGAASVGMQQDVFSYLRKLILLRAAALTTVDKNKISHAMQLINKNGRYTAAKRHSEDAVKRNWPLLKNNMKLSDRLDEDLKLISEAGGEQLEKPVQKVERGMGLNLTNEMAAKSVRMDKDRYALIKRLLILKERNLSANEKELVSKALEDINSNINIKKKTNKAVMDKLNELFAKHIPRKKETPYEVKRNSKAFELTMIHICEGCENTKDLIIPRKMEQCDRERAICSLATSVELINRFIRRLLGEDVRHHDEDHHEEEI